MDARSHPDHTVQVLSLGRDEALRELSVEACRLVTAAPDAAFRVWGVFLTPGLGTAIVATLSHPQPQNIEPSPP